MRRKIKYAALLVLLFIPFIVWAAQKTINTYMWDSNIQVIGGNATKSFTDGSSIVENTDAAVTVTTDPDNPANPMVTLGNSTSNTCGAIWLGGEGTTNVTCIDNQCPFGGGFRTYFEFRITDTDNSRRSQSKGEGFTFAFINGANNDKNRRGGNPQEAVYMAELLCYAGSDNTLNERGLDYPKMAVEFDLYPNTGTMNTNGCYGGRQDSSSHNNHIALMFWGDDTGGTCPNNNSDLRISYDDNIHGIPSAGSAITPQNTPSGSSGYYYRTKVSGENNWLEDNFWHSARIEVLRDATTHTYNVKAWVDCESCTGSTSTCTACTSTEIDNYFKDVLQQYYNTSSPRTGSVAPKIQNTVTLSSSLPSFEKILYGFTVATSNNTQTIQIRNLKTHFLVCGFTLDPMDAHFNWWRDSGNINVQESSGCPWTATSNHYWITIISGGSGTGNGTIPVSYSVDYLWVGTRTGTITIGDKTFKVTQTGLIH
ncbi:MAG: hypothetical protein GX642_13250 [Smithella sp.]|nr:hypothetical protein [Smithella sp.]